MIQLKIGFIMRSYRMQTDKDKNEHSMDLNSVKTRNIELRS